MRRPKVSIEAWRRQYNEVRTLSSLAYFHSGGLQGETSGKTLTGRAQAMPVRANVTKNAELRVDLI